ncbi:anthranilate phosphoribosyltransferase [Deinococcus psychrotolerans]|uniref:Anthranilate phosphoribosyltransferase n=1 Tax=Deinococcus psychrotolerans TaxID=2489213 RepID=A0A3G8YKX6_9DEIO|nr:anthranilate phosphoribosyltransferase [Deinococcus psychrotolerans]AZI42221.1 anthranilate phosphoribosyltransferase [Deinococcus psychrotolerans]
MIHARLMNGERLSQIEAAAFMDEVMSGDISATRLAAALSALRVRGETPEEIAGFAQSMRRHAVRVPVTAHPILLDTAGTGGDGANTFNISTTAAFVIAAGGVPVAKHGNRAASARAGSADVLEALGVNLDAPPQRSAQAIDELGVGFMFARNYHPALRHAAPVRTELASRTAFNVLGPISNPAGATHQVVGVYSPKLTRTLAEVLRLLGSKAALVVSGEGLDELTVCGPTQVSELRAGEVTDSVLYPADVDLDTYPLSALVGGDAHENAAFTRAILLGGGTAAQRDVVALNAGAGLYLAEKAPDLRGGVKLAQGILQSGAAWDLLERYAAYTHQ